MTRDLIAYAYLAQAKRTEGNLISGLMPIFKPITQPLAGHKFDPIDFSERVKSIYGFDVTPNVASALSSSMEEAGILTRVENEGKGFYYVYREIEEEFASITTNEIDDLLESFYTYVNENTEYIQDLIEIDKESLKDEFLNYLSDLSVVSEFIRKKPGPSNQKDDPLTLESSKKSKEPNAGQNRILSILCANFIKQCRDNNDRQYELICQISAGSLISEVVLNFQTPSTSKSLRGVNFALDTPFLMAYLDLSSEDETEAAKSLCDTLKAHGANLARISHERREAPLLAA